MGIRQGQSEFVLDVARLITYADSIGIELTFGDAFRSNEQQAIYFDTGKSKVRHSNHQDRLAIDFNYFIDGRLTYDVNDVKELGLYWESLNELNEAGMLWSWKDTPHFQRNKG